MTEQEAAVLLCRPCHGDFSSFKDECAKPPCQLQFPLKIEDGDMDLHNMVFEAEKLPYKKPVYLYRSYVLDGPAVAQKWRVAADRLILERDDRAYSDLDDGLGHVVFGRERELITNGAQATRIFQVAWIEEVVPTATGKAQLVRDHTDAVFLPGRRPWSAPAHALLRRCRDAGVQTSKMMKDDVLYSAPAALERDGDCWQVTFQEHLDTVVGYLDARTGSLLFVYLEYEG